MRARPPFVPALEGLRGLAVGAVLLFHGGFPWASGGFLGVSTFFTLSGFLITRLLLVEWEQTDAIDLGRFWGRRMRRLLPPLLLTVAGVALLAPSFAHPEQLWSLPGDALASLAFLANWRFTAEGQSYADLFKSPSLLLHCWSLGVEGQFYLLAPVALRAMMGHGNAPQALPGLRRVLTGLAVASVLATIGLSLTGSTADRVYYGTDTRMLELIVGAGLAAWLWGRENPAPRWMPTIGIAALAGTLGLWSVTTTTTPWIHAGGLGGYAVLSALLILGALSEHGPLCRLLSTRPLCALGRLSYGTYLYHWPVFLAFTPERVGLHGWPLFAARVAVTLALAQLSYRSVEVPARRGDTRTTFRALSFTWTSGIAVALAALALQARLPPPVDPFTEAVRTLEARREVDDTGDGVRYAIFGDSLGYGIEYALTAWTERHPGQLTWRRGEITAGCGLTGPAERAHWKTEDGCDDWQERWRARLRASSIDLAVVETVRWDVVEQRIPGAQGFTGPGDPAFDAFLLERMGEAVDLLTADGAVVVWLLSPPIEPRRGHLVSVPDSEPERVRRYNELVIELARQRPRQVALVDVPSHVASLTPSEHATLRPDGIHFSRNGAATFGEWLGPAVLAAYARLQPQTRARPVVDD